MEYYNHEELPDQLIEHTPLRNAADIELLVHEDEVVRARHEYSERKTYK